MLGNHQLHGLIVIAMNNDFNISPGFNAPGLHRAGKVSFLEVFFLCIKFFSKTLVFESF